MMSDDNEVTKYNERMFALVGRMKALSAQSYYLRNSASTDEDTHFHSGRLSAINDIIDYLIDTEAIE